MKKHPLDVLVPGIFAAAAIMLAVSVGAQTAPPAAPAPATTSPQASPMTRHHPDSAAMAKHEADMKAECQAMMARKQAMDDELKAMDATLDTLVAKMNAAKESTAPDAMEKPMAAVINELVSQRKTMRSMAMEMQPAMMAHMMRHMQMHGAMGAMDCPMIPKIKQGTPPEPKAEEKMPKM